MSKEGKSQTGSDVESEIVINGGGVAEEGIDHL